jgi:hypothetical protein
VIICEINVHLLDIVQDNNYNDDDDNNNNNNNNNNNSSSISSVRAKTRRLEPILQITSGSPS